MAKGDVVVCRHCKKEFIQGKNTFGIYCCCQCQQDYQWEQRKQKILADGRVPNSKLGRRFLLEKYGNVCQMPGCGCSTWDGEPVPLVLDHIDGNPDNWSLGNIRLICPNCDALTETYKGRNRGNGRYSRKNGNISPRPTDASHLADSSIAQDGSYECRHNRRANSQVKKNLSPQKEQAKHESPISNLDEQLRQLKEFLDRQLG